MTLEEIKELFSRDRFAMEQCGIVIESADENGACLSMPIKDHHLNANDVVQGGAIYTLCDTAFAVASNIHGVLIVNRNAQITYIKPGRGSVLTARAKQISRGATMCLYEISVYDQNENLIAHMTVNGFTAKR